MTKMGTWYRCAWCHKVRAVGMVSRCKLNPNWSPTPWGAVCQPDVDGIQEQEQEDVT